MVVSVFRLRASKGAAFGGSVVKNVGFAALDFGVPATEQVLRIYVFGGFPGRVGPSPGPFFGSPIYIDIHV